ncbi:MAG: hypothetical protein KatS3mg043_0757 [Rhodothermaceae bacterium]|nr:MAG: hypothetical protein KatS3mg043_0757 [Rhodothermaceae bacterium]
MERGGSNTTPPRPCTCWPPFLSPIIITTNYDRLFDRALKRALTLDGREKDPIVKVYNPDGAPEYVTLDPSERNPVLLKLHGDIENRDSIVVTEEDYLCFIEKDEQ